MYKKIILAFALVLFPSLALGSTYISFSSQNANYKAGDTFSVPIYIGSNDTDKIFTAKVALSYEPEYVEVVLFNFKEGAFSLTQPGYDKIDNANGLLIKTAGFTGGISSQTLFGTATFKSKKSGNTKISVSNDSQLLSGTNQNTLTSHGTLSIALGESQKQVKTPTEPSAEITQKTSKETKKAVSTSQKEKIAGDSGKVVPEKMNPVFLAALSLFAGINPIVFITIAILCLVSIFYLIRKKSS